MLTSDKEVVQLVVDQCKLHGVKTIVFSPGSRNSSLAIAFDEDDFFLTYVIHDERSAAFFALGLAQEKNDFVALCCTSGTAVINYYPAVAEAFYRKVPLLLLSADRPIAWIDQGDGQTIRQQHLFEKHAHGFFQLEDKAFNEEVLWYYQRETSILLQKLKKGPVHLNISLKEPLYSIVTKVKNYGKKISFSSLSKSILNTDLEIIKDKIFAKKIMVICGQLNVQHALISKLTDFSSRTGAVILSEHTSNLQNDLFISCLDRTLNMINREQEYRPEVVIHIGDAIVSKGIKAFLRNIPELEVIRVSEETMVQDTFQHLSILVSMDPLSFFNQFNDIGSNKTTNFFGKWKQLDLLAKDKIDSIAPSFRGLNDLYCFYLIHQLIQENTVIHLGNSSVVRYMQLFDMIKGCDYYSNRGTSGIDGSFSTAVGASVACPSKNHLFICGDISFIYDHNALWIKNFPTNLRVLIINNAGGGIFRMIEGAKDSNKNSEYFEATHNQQVIPIISAFSKNGFQINNEELLDDTLSNFLSFKESTFQFLEIITDRNSNSTIFSNFLQSMK